MTDESEMALVVETAHLSKHGEFERFFRLLGGPAYFRCLAFKRTQTRALGEVTPRRVPGSKPILAASVAGGTFIFWNLLDVGGMQLFCQRDPCIIGQHHC